MNRPLSDREISRIRRRRRLRRRRLAAAGLLVIVLAAVGIAIAAAGGGSAHRTTSSVAGSTTTAPATITTPAPRRTPSTFGVGIGTDTFTDTSRTIELGDGSTEPRTLITYVRYPAQGPAGATDVQGAAPDTTDGPYPLIVFGHGFEKEPALYAKLLQSWAHAGYVVAAPVFPLESARSPDGPQESDLVNQPQDMRFVIDQLLAESSGSGALAGLINPNEIAVAGHSDGGDTALSVAYDPRLRDSRISAAAILSGAEIPALGPIAFPTGGPPLLATQGTADRINPPGATYEYFAAAHPPKYLLRLLGAGHLPPYTVEGSQLHIVEHATIAFFNAYLKHRPGAIRELEAAGSVPGAATLVAEP